MTGRMEGKVALVTGAARGQGRSHAVRLAEEGADIIAVDLCDQIPSVTYSMSTEEDLAETGRLVEALGRRVVLRVADVRVKAELEQAIGEGISRLGQLDVVVANAGIAPIGPGPLGLWLDTVEVNLNGVVNTVQAAFPHLSAGASIVCTGSMASRLPGSVDKAGPGGAGYGHSKRAVSRLVHDLAQTLAPASIRVNAVHPGNINTPMLHNDAMYRMFRPDLDAPAREDAMSGFGSMHAMPVETIEPVDISEGVLFFASDATRYVTGQQLSIDAGGTLAATVSGAPD